MEGRGRLRVFCQRHAGRPVELVLDGGYQGCKENGHGVGKDWGEGEGGGGGEGG